MNSSLFFQTDQPTPFFIGLWQIGEVCKFFFFNFKNEAYKHNLKFWFWWVAFEILINCIEQRNQLAISTV